MAEEPDAVPGAIVILAVADLARAAAFWERAFGWPLVAGAPVYREYRAPGFRFALYVRGGFAANTGLPPSAAPAGSTTSTEIYVRVPDLAAAAAAVAAAGGRLLSPAADREWGDRAAYFADPDGNVVAVAEPPRA